MSCRFWAQYGNCTKGDACKFSHGTNAGDGGGGYGKMASSPAFQQGVSHPYGGGSGGGGGGICRFWQQYGNCSKGDACKFANTHTNFGGGFDGGFGGGFAGSFSGGFDGGGLGIAGGGVGMSAPGYGNSAPGYGDGVCRFWMQYGNCTKGDQCKFSHPGGGRSAGATGDNTGGSAACGAGGASANADVGAGASAAAVATNAVGSVAAAGGGAAGSAGGAGDGLCRFWQQYGNCTKGDACKFTHLKS
eukprot:TRINITY_DN94067_c0_g1_i1.p1 TRINITY_DN94067_c0_g1~~TRINITY_DN94067_c0_g1_i1.p1  ORF type:complete len:246 (-),score=51.83 TRINITY_DN94067_c0_g1_i1:300-1037(-)